MKISLQSAPTLLNSNHRARTHMYRQCNLICEGATCKLVIFCKYRIFFYISNQKRKLIDVGSLQFDRGQFTFLFFLVYALTISAMSNHDNGLCVVRHYALVSLLNSLDNSLFSF